MSFSHWAHYLLPIFSKVQGSVQNSVFSPRSARFVNSALGEPLLSHFQQSARACKKQKFSARDQTVLSFLHWGAPLVSVFSKVHEFVQKSVFSPRLDRFANFALGAPIFSDFKQSTRIYRKQRFSAGDHHVLSFSHWAHYLLPIFSKVRGLYKTVFSARDQHVL